MGSDSRNRFQFGWVVIAGLRGARNRFSDSRVLRRQEPVPIIFSRFGWVLIPGFRGARTGSSLDGFRGARNRLGFEVWWVLIPGFRGARNRFQWVSRFGWVLIPGFQGAKNRFQWVLRFGWVLISRFRGARSILLLGNELPWAKEEAATEMQANLKARTFHLEMSRNLENPIYIYIPYHWNHQNQWKPNKTQNLQNSRNRGNFPNLEKPSPEPVRPAMRTYPNLERHWNRFPGTGSGNWEPDPGFDGFRQVLRFHGSGWPYSPNWNHYSSWPTKMESGWQKTPLSLAGRNHSKPCIWHNGKLHILEGDNMALLVIFGLHQNANGPQNQLTSSKGFFASHSKENNRENQVGLMEQKANTQRHTHKSNVVANFTTQTQ